MFEGLPWPGQATYAIQTHLPGMVRHKRPQVNISNRKCCRVGASFAHAWFKRIEVQTSQTNYPTSFLMCRLCMSQHRLTPEKLVFQKL
jgi:hypothetical protein